MANIRIALAQFDFPVGAIDANADRILALTMEAKAAGADLILFPESAISGYLAEDLFLRPSFIATCERELARIAPFIQGIDAVIGHPLADGEQLFNALSWIRDGRTLVRYRKQALPNYTVFDEKRYFDAGDQAAVVELQGVRFGPLICEDVWEEFPARRALQAGAEALLVINASPFDPINRARRHQVVAARAKHHQVPIAYVNIVGGQDDIVFDGGAFVAHPDGTLGGPAPAFEDHLLYVDLNPQARRFEPINWPKPETSDDARLYSALVRATRDYVDKNGFPGVLLGLSGGVDSALTLAIAADALGPKRVTAVMMPSRFTSELSRQEAAAQADVLGVAYHVVSIEQAFTAYRETLAPLFGNRPPDITEENLQARIRGMILMALSNKFGAMVLSTGNKSEMACGYATLYGDMCGGFAPLKDVYKTEVWDLCRYRNTLSPVIPEVVINRPPSAELRDNQTDQDSLPPYELLDQILMRYIEHDKSRAEIISEGFDEATVQRVVRMVLRNEYKRRQAAPGPRITRRAFGRDRRYPITTGWR
ncbi:MAG: NAD+ synthase [Ahniella sp.]|nr:NAD+ synthase [Ahniella sp.]